MSYIISPVCRHPVHTYVSMYIKTLQSVTDIFETYYPDYQEDEEDKDNNNNTTLIIIAASVTGFILIVLVVVFCFFQKAISTFLNSFLPQPTQPATAVQMAPLLSTTSPSAGKI